MTRATNALPVCPRHGGHDPGAALEDGVYVCYECLLPLESPILHAARVAAAAITAALDTERRAANEVEARGGERSARMTLEADRRAAWRAVLDLAAAAPPGVALELAEMAEAARLGYARPAWALRVVQIATEVSR